MNIGEAAGVIAAQSIGEPGTQLTMRTFHIGGTASRRVEQSTLESRHQGAVKFANVRLVVNSKGQQTVMNRNGQVIILDETGRERERYRLTYGARLLVKEGHKVEANSLLAEWDPYMNPIITEIGGAVGFSDIIEGVTIQEQLDEVTGLTQRVIIEPKDPEARPAFLIKDEERKEPARYLLPVGAMLVVNEGDTVEPGDVVAKIPRETTKTKDITGGLPRVAELFEARKPKETAIIAEVDGTVSFGKDTKGKRKVLVTPEFGEPSEYLVPKGKHISVHEGDFIRAGEPIMDGAVNPHDILRVLGERALSQYLVDEIQEVYRLQGVKIHDKHIEVIVKQMLKKVKIKEVGDTLFLVGENVDKHVFHAENEKVKAEGGKPATAEPLLLGITKGSLATESFISASSFQETTKVLTEAAVQGRTDYLLGLKENVIMGRLIPAGTGVPSYIDVGIEVEEIIDEVPQPEAGTSEQPVVHH